MTTTEEQLTVWADEVVHQIGEYLRDDLSTGDSMQLCRDLCACLKDIVGSSVDLAAPRTGNSERRAEEILVEACKPWEHYTGEPPDDGSPLSAVFVAGMVYTERLLAKLLNVTHYEGGDGSEDFDNDAAQTLRNILTGAGLWDADENRPVAPAPSSPGVPTNHPDVLKFAGQLVDEIDGLIETTDGIAGLHRNGDLATWEELLPEGEYERLSSLDMLREALTSANTAGAPLPSSPGVPDSVRALSELEQKFNASRKHALENAERAKPREDLYDYYCGQLGQASAYFHAVRTVQALLSTHPAGQGAVADALAEFQRRNGYHKSEIEELLTEFGELLLSRVRPAPDSTRTGQGEAGAREIIPFKANFRHKKTGGLYQTLDVVTNGTNGDANGQKMVLYTNGMKSFVREYSEFFDGRFERIQSADTLAARPAAPEVQGAERVRHVKRGTEYEVLGEAEAQVSGSDSRITERRDWLTDAIIMEDGDKLMVYRGTDGRLWCRPTDEFRDGRFVPAPPSSGQESA